MAVGMIVADEFAVAAAQRRAIGVGGEAEQLHRVMLLARQARIGRLAARLVHPLAKTRAERVHRILEIGPARRQVGAARGTEGAAFGFPAGRRRLRRHDLVGVHSREKIIARVELAHMVEARSEERRVGKEGVSKWRCWWSRAQKKKKTGMSHKR